MTRVGFVGLGNIGRPMAERLAGADAVELWVHDIAPEPVDALVEAGARSAGSVTELAAAVEVLCVMVRDDDQVRAVLADVLASGGAPVVVVHSTVAPETPVALAAEGAEHGVMVVDAPVSGGPMGAADGTLAIMVGAERGTYEQIRPVLKAMGAKVVHAGPVGSGTAFKLARNLLHFVSFTAATEAARLAEAAGLDLKRLGDVVRHTDAITGGAGSVLYRETTAPIPEDDFWYGIFCHVRTLGEKDLTFATRLADELGVEVPLARIALDRLGPGLGLERDGTRDDD